MALILCVEDEIDLREGVVEELREEGYEVLEAGNGLEALEILEKHTPTPDLVVSDITMPEMTGLAMLKEMKSYNNHISEIPVIFLTALNHKHYYDEAMKLGATTCLLKPIDWDTFMLIISGTLD